MRKIYFAIILISLIFGSASSQAQTRQQPVVVKLAPGLREISGVACTRDGRLFCHNDELGYVFQVDPANGTILKKFRLGKSVVTADFEDICIVDKQFYMIVSNGVLCGFTEGNDKEAVEFWQIQTGLSEKNNIEGLCYDPETKSLLLACKDFPGKKLGSNRAVYSFSIADKQLSKNPRFIIDRDQVCLNLRIDNFKPSAIVRNPADGSFLILSANEPAILQYSKEAKLLKSIKLSKKLHPQPEGICIMPDGRVIISNEGKGHGTLVIYQSVSDLLINKD